MSYGIASASTCIRKGVARNSGVSHSSWEQNTLDGDHNPVGKFQVRQGGSGDPTSGENQGDPGFAVHPIDYADRPSNPYFFIL
jgi:hypothetical protein